MPPSASILYIPRGGWKQAMPALVGESMADCSCSYCTVRVTVKVFAGCEADVAVTLML